MKSVISVPIKDCIHHYPRALFNDKHKSLIGTVSVSFCFPHAVAFSDFMICVYLFQYCLCVLYLSLWSSVNPNIFGCVFMDSIVLSIC